MFQNAGNLDHIEVLRIGRPFPFRFSTGLLSVLSWIRSRRQAIEAEVAKTVAPLLEGCRFVQRVGTWHDL